MPYYAEALKVPFPGSKTPSPTLEVEMSQLDVLHSWHHIRISHWNSLSSRERSILSQMFAEADTAHLRACFYSSVAMNVIGTSEFNDSDGRVFTVGNIVHASLDVHSYMAA